MPLHRSSTPLAHPAVCHYSGWEAPAAETGPSLAFELVTLSGSGSRTWRRTGQSLILGH